MKNYTALSTISTFDERLAYLKLEPAKPGEHTFGGLRYINQSFYKSKEWAIIKAFVITRDRGFDLGVTGYPIVGPVYVHHMNPIDVVMLVDNPELALDPEFLISTSLTTHNSIHFGSKPTKNPFVERRENDTIFWERL